ncbi:MAG TPA: hypothetical protein PLO26_12180, partial [Nitrosomonas europaea]|uniref:tetratricopeptide repeat protein n=1 Tax=Nitrosomonas europaea TaxID=915 RepID=UPI002C9FE958
HDLQTYEDKAVALAADTKTHKAMRQKLALAKESGPLFDSLRFTRNLEQQYTALVSELQNQSQHINISTQPEPTKLGESAQLNPITATVQEAEALQARGDTQGAIQLYRQWLKHSNSQYDWLIQFNLGILLRDGGDITGAQQAFQTVLKQKPDFVQARVALEQMMNAILACAVG